MAKLVIEFDNDSSNCMSNSSWQDLLEEFEDVLADFFNQQSYNMQLTEDE